MNIPEQVRRSAERANELLSQANDVPGDPPAEPAAPEPQATPPVVPAPEPAAPAEPPAAPPAPSVATDWEQKYRTLQGVFTAETAKLKQQNKDLEARFTALEARAPAAPPAPAPATQFDAKDLETYGPELLDLIQRQATAQAQRLVAEQMAGIAPQLEQTRTQVESVSQAVYKTDRERFFGELAREVPDWATIDEDPRWLAWLGEVDPLSGVPRQAYIDNAGQAMDHARTANLFNAFKKEAGLTPPPAAPAPPAPAAPAFSPSPRTVGNASAPALRTTEVEVKRSEIGAHYRRSATDAAYRASAEHTAFEQRMQAATQAGKVIEG